MNNSNDNRKPSSTPGKLEGELSPEATFRCRQRTLALAKMRPTPGAIESINERYYRYFEEKPHLFWQLLRMIIGTPLPPDLADGETRLIESAIGKLEEASDKAKEAASRDGNE